MKTLIDVNDLPDVLKVTVTPWDDRQGKVDDCENCPLAIALDRDWPIAGNWRVFQSVSEAEHEGGIRKFVHPEPLCRAIKAFDQTRTSFVGVWYLEDCNTEEAGD